ncbi:hypothetical protein [Psittacicella hinzii]|nr:hypothetical protein [Psittacicella hinzii]
MKLLQRYTSTFPTGDRHKELLAGGIISLLYKILVTAPHVKVTNPPKNSIVDDFMPWHAQRVGGL